MINDGDSFVLNAPDKIYVFDGPHASPFEKRQANETAENMERSRPLDPLGWQALTGGEKHFEVFTLTLLYIK